MHNNNGDRGKIGGWIHGLGTSTVLYGICIMEYLVREIKFHSQCVHVVFEVSLFLTMLLQVSASAGLRRRREVEEENERERFEEEHFVRLQNKRRKEAGRGVGDTVKELTDFGDIEALIEDGGGLRDKVSLPLSLSLSHSLSLSLSLSLHPL